MPVLSQSQVDQLARKLEENYQTLVRIVRDELENSGNQHRIELLNREPGDSGDESLANALADFNLTLLDRHIDGSDEYGVCIDCGENVTFPRLMAYPTAKRCIGCQGQREKQYAQERHPTM